MAGLDIRRGSCGNIGQNVSGASVTGASSAYATPPERPARVLTAKDIERRYGKSARQARRDIADAIAAGVPTVPSPVRGRGRPPVAVDDAAYIAWRFGVRWGAAA